MERRSAATAEGLDNLAGHPEMRQMRQMRLLGRTS